MPARNGRVTQYRASTLPRKVRSIASAVSSSRGRPLTTPALLTTTSTPPVVARTSSAAARTAAGSPTSQAWVDAAAPRRRTSSATGSNRERSRSHRTRCRAPRRAASSDTRRPRPAAAPVTSTVAPCIAVMSAGQVPEVGEQRRADLVGTEPRGVAQPVHREAVDERVEADDLDLEVAPVVDQAGPHQALQADPDALPQRVVDHRSLPPARGACVPAGQHLEPDLGLR